MADFELRSMQPGDRAEVAELIYCSINVWYQQHGRPPIFLGGPAVTDIFYETYEALTPGCNVVAASRATGRLMGSCFYHPRERHVSLGIMNVHPNYWGAGVGSALLRHIIDYTESHDYPALRLTQSALNLDSFSLYSKAGFVPRYAYQDMYLQVPEAGLGRQVPGEERIRPATLDDVPAMAALELAVSGIERPRDYRFAIENRQQIWNVTVLEGASGLDGYLISCGHPAMNLLGPGVARTEEAAAALVHRHFDFYRGRCPVVLAPMEKQHLVRSLYDWGARNCELHLCQVRGKFQPFDGVNLPSFLPETG